MPGLVGELRYLLNDQCDFFSSKIPGTVCRDTTRYIEGISNSDGSTGTLELKVDSSYIPSAPGSTDYSALLTLFQDQIARVFEAAINCNKNRYRHFTQHKEWVGLYGKKDWRTTDTYDCKDMANSADWYEVSIRGLPGDERPHLRVSVHFDGKSEEGQFDCRGTLSNAWGSLDEHRVKFQYAKALNKPMAAAIDCGDKDGIGAPTGICPSRKTKEGVHCLRGDDPGPGACEHPPAQ